ncbi:thioredoxin-like protein [Hyaloraphidium curvatum]|nr:thioredoxin-like protein [Hyaloraphidium curvatum]
MGTRRRETRPLKFLSLFCLCLAVISALLELALADEKHKDGAVVHLDEAAFQNEIASGTKLIFWGATWCPHCVALTPTWGQLTTRLADLASRNFRIFKVECTENEQLCKSQRLAGYPSIILFHDGKRVDDYHGSRALEDLERYARSKADQYAVEAPEEGEVVSTDDVQETEDVAESPRAPVEAIRGDIQRVYSNIYPSGGDAAGDGSTIVLDSRNFDEQTLLQPSSPIFVKFYAPWCQHCQKLMPTWDKLGQNPDVKGKVRIGKVDCTSSKELCKRFEVKGYPSLKLVHGNDTIDYRGPRSAESLVAFCQAQLKLPVLATTASSLHEDTKDQELAFVFLYSDHDGAADLMAKFIRVARRFHHKAPFVVSSDPELLRELDPSASAKDLPRIYVIRLSDHKNPTRFCRSHDLEGILEWVGEKMELGVQELNEGTASTLMSGENGKLVVLGVLDPGVPSGTALIGELRKAAGKAAKELAGEPRVVFGYLDGKRFKDYASKLYGYRGEPRVVVSDPAGQKYYDVDAKGHAIAPHADDMIAAAREARAGTLPVRYTDNWVIRTFKAVSKATQGFGEFVTARPWILVAFVLSVAALGVYLLFVFDDSGHHAKTGGKAE